VTTIWCRGEFFSAVRWYEGGAIHKPAIGFLASGIAGSLWVVLEAIFSVSDLAPTCR
jgi:hypothetical protein